MRLPPGTPMWTCKCGKASPGVFSTCIKCGKPKGSTLYQVGANVQGQGQGLAAEDVVYWTCGSFSKRSHPKWSSCNRCSMPRGWNERNPYMWPRPGTGPQAPQAKGRNQRQRAPPRGMPEEAAVLALARALLQGAGAGWAGPVPPQGCVHWPPLGGAMGGAPGAKGKGSQGVPTQAGEATANPNLPRRLLADDGGDARKAPGRPESVQPTAGGLSSKPRRRRSRGGGL